MDELKLGERLKRLRRHHELTLAEVAKGAGVSKSFVSQIETGAAQPSIGTLKRIVDVFGVSLANLFDGEEEGETHEPEAKTSSVRIVRKNMRKHLRWPNGAIAELLTPNLQGNLEVLLTVHGPVSDIEVEPYTHEGEEFGLVLEGTYEVVVNDEVFVIEEGDAIHFQSHQPHTVRAIGEVPPKVLWVITPPTF